MVHWAPGDFLHAQQRREFGLVGLVAHVQIPAAVLAVARAHAAHGHGRAVARGVVDHGFPFRIVALAPDVRSAHETAGSMLVVRAVQEDKAGQVGEAPGVILADERPAAYPDAAPGPAQAVHPAALAVCPAARHPAVHGLPDDPAPPRSPEQAFRLHGLLLRLCGLLRLHRLLRLSSVAGTSSGIVQALLWALSAFCCSSRRFSSRSASSCLTKLLSTLRISASVFSAAMRTFVTSANSFAALRLSSFVAS